MTKITRGPVERVAGAYDEMFTGQIGIAFPAQAIYQEQRAILEVIVQNDPGSAVNAFIGNEFNQYLVLTPGQSITIPINNLNRVWAGTAGGAATINWLAMV